MAHTPGSWSWRLEDGDWYLAPGVMIVQSYTDGTPGGDEIDRANARLIAAAPDLLEALVSIRGWREIGSADTLAEKLRAIEDICDAAIAKARGQ